MKRYRFTYWNVIVFLCYIIIRIGICLLPVYLFDLPVLFNIICFTGIVFPSIYLFLKFLYEDEGKTLLINEENEIVLIQKNKNEIILTNSTKVIVNCSVALKRKVIPLLIEKNMYYILFQDHNNQKVIVTSILNKNLIKLIEERIDPYKIEYNYFMLY